MAARDTSGARAAAHATRVVGRETMGEDAFARPSSREHGLEEVEVRRAGKAPRLLQAQSIEFVNSTNISPRLARNGHAFVSARSAGTRRKHLSPWRRIGLLNVAFLSSPTPPATSCGPWDNLSGPPTVLAGSPFWRRAAYLGTSLRHACRLSRTPAVPAFLTGSVHLAYFGRSYRP